MYAWVITREQALKREREKDNAIRRTSDSVGSFTLHTYLQTCMPFQQ